MDKVGMIYMIFILSVIFVGAWIGLADAIERVRASMRCHEEWSAFKKHKATARYGVTASKVQRVVAEAPM